MIVVSDTGPINYLVQIRRIELLGHLFSVLVIPSTVIEELLDIGAPGEVRAWSGSLPNWVSVQAPRNLSSLSLSTGRGRGERAAIALAKELGAPILSDDRQARNIARSEGLEVSGTLGILQEAHAQGFDDIDQALQDLQKTNFHVSQSLIEKTRFAAEQLRQLVRKQKGL